LTFAVALSASSEKGPDSLPSSATIAAPDNNQAASAISPEPTAEPTEAGAAAESEQPQETDATENLDAPEITAQSAFALDVKSGKTLSALNADERRPMASLTKMVTALVVTKALNDDLIALDDSVTIEDSDVVDPAIYSHMGLVAGDTVTVEQLLDGMLIPSGNDAAKALARYVGERLRPRIGRHRLYEPGWRRRRR
jgi:serine-type D-Ala-D-Ala carboxypeptidase (penicillin-binding protein 5/6)